MKTNLAFWDRMLRYFFGILLASWAVAGGPWWAYLGIYMILTASWGLCPIYAFFRVQTTKSSDQSLVSE